ncbi:hypothetical protein CDD83_7643 [Cordyceps sp. RAO-2017]|nr:hypothetical protein CDD83_7643 [Cordyceps sp. RAO-2017]
MIPGNLMLVCGWGLGLFAGTGLAVPSSELETRDEPLTAHLTFRAASSEETYTMAVLADGNPVKTGHETLAVGLVDAPDYLAQTFCNFQMSGEASISSKIASDNVTQQVVIDPPQPILSVSCRGFCVGIYGACYGSDGQYVGPCCNGVCIATRCRPWNIGHQG